MKYNEKCYYKINFIGWQGLFKERETRYSQNNLDLGKTLCVAGRRNKDSAKQCFGVILIG